MKMHNTQNLARSTLTPAAAAKDKKWRFVKHKQIANLTIVMPTLIVIMQNYYFVLHVYIALYDLNTYEVKACSDQKYWIEELGFYQVDKE